MQVAEVIAYAWPRSTLVRRYRQARTEVRELRDAAVRSAKNSEALRADLRRERAEVARLTKETP